MSDQLIPNFHPALKSVQMMTGGKIHNVPYEEDAEPLNFPKNLKWQNIPQAWEALRYAQAAVPRAPSLSPPDMFHLQDRNNYGAEGLTAIDGIGLTKRAWNSAAMPYVLPKSVNPRMANFTGVLPHELTHYLTMHAARKAKQDEELYAQQIFERFGKYKPMYGNNAGNADANFHERLANRVAMPYVDAQVVGQKAAPLLEQANRDPFKYGADQMPIPFWRQS